MGWPCLSRAAPYLRGVPIGIAEETTMKESKGKPKKEAAPKANASAPSQKMPGAAPPKPKK